MSDAHDYTISISPSVLDDLGINLYSNIPAVIFELSQTLGCSPD